MQLATVVAAVSAEAHHGNVMLDTIWFPIGALVIFGLLAMVTFSYRDVANRHAAKAEAYARAHSPVQNAHAEDGA